MKTSQLICRTNQLIGFYVMTSLVFNQLMLFQFFMPYVNAIRLAVFVLLGKKTASSVLKENNHFGNLTI